MALSRSAALLAVAGLLTSATLSAGSMAEAAIAPMSAAPDPTFTYGTWSDAMSLSTEDSRARLDQQKTDGVQVVRQYVFWDRIETSKGVFDWSVFDRVVGDAATRGIDVLPTLLYPPSWALSPDAPPTSTVRPPENPQDLADFATALVQRYGPLGTYWACTRFPPVVGNYTCPANYRPIKTWEVWNEPDIAAWWGGAPNAAEYVALLVPTFNAIKAADPTSTVAAAGMTNRVSNPGGFLEQVYQLDGGEHFDLLGFNPYARDVGSAVAFVRAVRDIATRYGDADVPIYLLEYGWATGGRSTYIVTSEDCQAALVNSATRRFSALREELGISGLVQFQWQDPVVAANNNQWPNFAGLKRSDGSDKPGRIALAQAIAGQATTGDLAVANACPADRQSIDGRLQRFEVSTNDPQATIEVNGRNCAIPCVSFQQPGTQMEVTVQDQARRVVSWRGQDAHSCTGTSCSFVIDTPESVAPSNAPYSHSLRATYLPFAEPGRIEQDDEVVSLRGEWRKTRGGSYSKRSAILASATAVLDLRFNGTAIKWIGRKGPRFGLAKVVIDGKRYAIIDAHHPKRRKRAALIKITGLTPGLHTMRIRVLGRHRPPSKGDQIVVDAFKIR